MRKLSLLASALVVLLLTACASPASMEDAAPVPPVVVVEASTPAPDTTSEPADIPDAEEPHIESAPADTPDIARDTTNDDALWLLLNELLKNAPPPSLDVDSEECNPFFSNCLYDPFYGSCHWDFWRGVYVCDSYFYRPGYDCSYDWWWGEYTCRKTNDSWGWGW